MRIIKTTFLLFAIFASQMLFATSYTISTSGLSYSPDSLSVEVGDTVTIQASTMHPLVQVSMETWSANGNEPFANGWGTKTSDYTFVVESDDDIYYVCGNHVGSGMKGMITVTSSEGVNQTEKIQSNFRIYPVPYNNGFLTFKGDVSNYSNLEIIIYNISGAKVYAQNVDRQQVDIRLDVSSGFYFYTIRNKSEGIIDSGKLIITK